MGGITLGGVFSDGVISYLCHKLGKYYGGHVRLVKDHGGDGGDGDGEGVPWGLSDGLYGEVVEVEGPVPRLGGLR